MACVVCKKKGGIVKHPKLEDIQELCSIARERVTLGELKYKPLVDLISKLQSSELATIRYHSESRKPIVNKTNLERVRKRVRSDSPTIVPQGGRPCASSDNVRPKRFKTKPKETICVFASCSFCSSSMTDPLHRTYSNGRGQDLLHIRDNTTDDTVRASVADLEGIGDAAALEKYYHSACLRTAQRTCPQTSNVNESMIRKLCDIQLLMSVRGSLSAEGAVLNMNQINDEYVSLLKEHKLKFGWHHKKYLKDLILNWIQKTKVKVGEKVFKLREDRQFLGRCLIIQESRPELVPKLADMIGNYELSVVPRSMFAVDGSLLLPSDKASIIHAIEVAKSTPQPSVSVSDDSTDPPFSAPHDTSAAAKSPPRVLIIDAMAVLQGMKKSQGMTTILHLKTAFNARVGQMIKGYVEARIIFDRYVKGGLKEKTRSKRAVSDDAASAGHDVHDGMSINTISLKQLLSCTTTKHNLSCHLGQGLLERFDGENVKLVVVYDTVAKTINPWSPPESHSHEEADTLIPLHVLLSLQECTWREVHVWSPDTDVLVLLMDLASRGRLGALTQLKFLTGKGSKHREVDVCERVRVVGRQKSRALLGFHHFTGTDWGGKFVGISKKTWVTAFLSLDDNDPIIETFSCLGEGPISTPFTAESDAMPIMPAHLQHLETFVCKVYAPKSSTRILPDLRWELFRAKNLESEMLPPTRGTLIPHIQRVKYVVMRDKGYTSSQPSLPSLEGNGWSKEEMPVRCLVPPAPRAVIEMVKCGCKGECKGNCSCAKNELDCTPLCKCYAKGCRKQKDYYANEDEDEEEEEDNAE